MRLNYDKKQDALYIKFDKSPYAESDEVKEGIIFDYDKDEKIIGIEILDASLRLHKNFKSEIFKKNNRLSLKNIKFKNQTKIAKLVKV